MAQQIEPFLAVRGSRRERLVIAPAGPIAAVKGRHGRDELCAAQMLIEHLALRAALDQMLKFLLTMDFYEEFRKFAQRLNRHQLAVDVGARTAVRARHPAHRDLAVVLNGLLLEP